MKRILIIFLAALGFIQISFTVMNSQKTKPWAVPDNFKKMKNAVASSPASIAEGKALWTTHCKSCHGAKGLGDGSKAAQLDTEPGNFSKTQFQSHTDGELFYKLTEGRDDMPSFKKKIASANDRWNVVNFMRTLKKK